ncbi:hypothetical protein EV193_105179 [Herbihabitans rhizosphaerae]|uniref:Glycoprotein n=2 Tax=Herbihabitans rhizosphaerae TaxID=1872711 RepID=A0A4Q7KPK1_9PSEU|nr:hypothetical protein EV193_105179 [Herbihabitans rhizosphaerae]
MAAAAQPSGGTTTPRSVQDAPSRLSITVEQLTPRVVTTDTPSITVVAKLTNNSERAIDDLDVRLERGAPLTSESKLRDALTQTKPDQTERSRFLEAGSLRPGASTTVTLAVSVNGADNTLKINRPGVYQLWVNVNGQPAGTKDAANLGYANLLLPVISAPVNGSAPSPPAPKPRVPAGVTMMWPLVDERPRIVQTVGDREVLADEGLTASLAPGGRLFSLVNAADLAIAKNPALGQSLCFAVDPDLLATVAAMAKGYLVRVGDGPPAPGIGVAPATQWLDRVRRLTNGKCVLALPYADVDLDALSRAGAGHLQTQAMSAGTDRVREVLAPVQPQPGLLWPVGGTLEQRTVSDLSHHGPVSVVVDPAKLRRDTGRTPYLLRSGLPAGSRALAYDQLTSSLLAGDNGTAQGLAASQNGLAAVLFRAAWGGADSMLITPPRRWTATSADLEALLDGVSLLADQQYVAPKPVQRLMTDPTAGTAEGMEYGAQDSTSEVAGSITAEVMRVNAVQRDLLGAMAKDAALQVEPHTLVTPLQFGLLRATSSAWRADPAGGHRAAEAVDGQVRELLGRVQVEVPGRPASLASRESRFSVTVRNSLPVLVQVRIVVARTAGLSTKQPPDITVAAGHARTEWVDAEVLRSGRFAVTVSITTPGHTPFSQPKKLDLSSTEYGTITLAVTWTAGGLLVLLSGLRIFRRVRANRAAKADTPSID